MKSNITTAICFVGIIKLLASCTLGGSASPATSCIPDTLVHIRYLDKPLLPSPVVTFTYMFQENEAAFKYCCGMKDSLLNWMEHLPDSILHDIAAQKLAVQKVYYVSDIIMKNFDKSEDIVKNDRILENALRTILDPPNEVTSTVFSTQLISSEEADRGKQESFVLQINRFRYQQEDYDQQATEDKK